LLAYESMHCLASTGRRSSAINGEKLCPPELGFTLDPPLAEAADQQTRWKWTGPISVRPTSWVGTLLLDPLNFATSRKWTIRTAIPTVVGCARTSSPLIPPSNSVFLADVETDFARAGLARLDAV
jgi:hypothetical protein